MPSLFGNDLHRALRQLSTTGIQFELRGDPVFDEGRNSFGISVDATCTRAGCAAESWVFDISHGETDTIRAFVELLTPKASDFIAQHTHVTTASPPHDRMARFFVSDQWVRDGDYELLARMMSGLLILHAQWQADRQAIEYIAWGARFPQKDRGAEAPLWYVATQVDRFVLVPERPENITIRVPFRRERSTWERLLAAAQEEHPMKTIGLVYPNGDVSYR